MTGFLTSSPSKLLRKILDRVSILRNARRPISGSNRARRRVRSRNERVSVLAEKKQRGSSVPQTPIDDVCAGEKSRVSRSNISPRSLFVAEDTAQFSFASPRYVRLKRNALTVVPLALCASQCGMYTGVVQVTMDWKRGSFESSADGSESTQRAGVVVAFRASSAARACFALTRLYTIFLLRAILVQPRDYTHSIVVVVSDVTSQSPTQSPLTRRCLWWRRFSRAHRERNARVRTKGEEGGEVDASGDC